MRVASNALRLAKLRKVAYDRDQLKIVCNIRLLKYIAAGVKWTLFLGRSRITGMITVSMHVWTASSFKSESL